MGIMMVTSLNSYAKTMAMAMKWQKKQEENNYAPDNTDSGSVQDSFQKKLDEIRYPRYDRSSQMEGDIEIKLTAGKKLSAEEMTYLKNHDRATYQKAKIINRERAAYEKALASCTTKDEVEQLKASYAEAAVRRINAIRNNPSASRDQKRELFQMEHYKAAALDDAMHEFMKSPEYEALPSAPAPRDPSQKDQSAIDETGNPDSKPTIAGSEVTLKPIQEQLAARDKAIKEAAQYEISKLTDSKDDQKKFQTMLKKFEDDACEEGSIMKAILDEEARWAQEEEGEEDASDPQDVTLTQPREPSPGYLVNQAKAAYLAALSYDTDPKPSAIDIRK